MKRKTLGPIICLMCLVCLSPAAHAALTIVSAVGAGPPAGVNYVNFDGLVLDGGQTGSGIAQNTGFSANPVGSVSVGVDPTGKLVTGSIGGEYAAPFLSGTNGAYFGTFPNPQANGQDGTPYLTTGSLNADAGSRVELTFTGSQQYLGLLWGSVDDYNTLEFLLGGVPIAGGVLTGLDVTAFANGNQGVNGTYYVSINSDLPFDSVVFTSQKYAFEFDNVAYSANQIPEPASLIVWSVLGLSVAGAGWWRRRKAAA